MHRPPDSSRINWLTAVFLAFIFVLAVRLFNLQVVHHERYLEDANSNRTRFIRDRAQRGRMVDRNGVLLTGTKPSFSLYITPEDFPRGKRQRVFEKLGAITGVSPDKIQKRYDEIRTSGFRPRKIHGNLSSEQVVRIETSRYHLPGVSIAAENVRAYPFDNTLCHVLGYVGEISSAQLQLPAYSGYRVGDSVGKTGLEKTYESLLNGQDGYRWVEVDAAGRQGFTLRYPPPVPAVSGADLHVTVDLELQLACEEYLDPWKGCIIVLDPRNGDILALVSRPGFNPNNFAGGISQQEWQSIAGNPDDPLLNRAIQFEAPPGSIFKVITTAAALNNPAFRKHSTYYCSGEFNYSNHVYRCWNNAGHGTMDIISAMENSCNVYYYQAGLNTGIDLIARTARDFGLGSITGIDLPGEKSGLMPDRQWKKRVFNEEWWPGETISVSIGQGGVTVTPMQLAQLMAIVANRGILYQPRLVNGCTSHLTRDTEQFKPVIETDSHDFQNWELVTEALHRVVSGATGTARRVKIREMSFAGKTGTAQVIGLQTLKQLGYRSEDALDPRFRSHSWFAGFGPVDSPEVVIVVLIENGGSEGARERLVIARKTLQKWFELNRPGYFGPEPDAPGEGDLNGV
jgi:penicillin-binding protein 2